MTSDKELSKKKIRELIDRDCPTILDIGAFNGKDSKEIARQWKRCRVHAFDPFLKLRKPLFGKRKIKVWNFCISDIDGFKFMERSNHSQSDSLLKPKEHLNLFPYVHFDIIRNQSVPCFKLDTWSKVNNQWGIDFIWCDVNGSEGDVIKGATETLKRTRFLYIEFSDKELYEGQLNKEQLIDLLPEYWELQGIYNYKGNFGNLLLKNTML